jgi:hypothetical protein
VAPACKVEVAFTLMGHPVVYVLCLKHCVRVHGTAARCLLAINLNVVRGHGRGSHQHLHCSWPRSFEVQGLQVVHHFCHAAGQLWAHELLGMQLGMGRGCGRGVKCHHDKPAQGSSRQRAHLCAGYLPGSGGG